MVSFSIYKLAILVNYYSMELATFRKQNQITQKEAAQIVGVPYRTYIRYEENPSYINSYKYRMIFSLLKESLRIDEEHGLLSIDKIKDTVVPIMKKNDISFCFLFGSYAKGTAKENSDVDLLIDTDLTGLKFYGLVEELRVALCKKVDLLRLKDLKNDNPIALEILKEGIKIL